jgi:ketopantoate reductase
MKTLIVGAGALGGIIGARLLAVGAPVSLATRNAASAEEIKASGLPQMLASRLGDECVLGGLSNLGATMVRPVGYEQRNAGYLLIGELGGGESERSERVRQRLSRAINVKVTPNLQGAVWSKLLLNCSVTTLGGNCRPDNA